MSDNKPMIGYQSLLTVSNVAATSEQTAFPATNLANVQTFSAWKSNTLSDQYITVSHGTAQIDYIGIAGHNFDEAGCSVSVECQGVSGGDWVEIVSPRPVSTDRPLMLFSAGDSVTVYATRIKIASAAELPQMSVLYVGKALELPRRRYKSYTPPTYSKEQSVVNGTSESGQFLGRIMKSESAGGEIEVKLIDPAWYRSTFDLFVTHAKTMPWFYAWRPQDYPDEAVFAWATNPIIPENTSVRDFMAATIKYNCIA